MSRRPSSPIDEQRDETLHSHRRRNISDLKELGMFACCSSDAHQSVLSAPIWSKVCSDKWPLATSFIYDLQYKYRGMDGPYYSLFCRRSRLPLSKTFCDLTDFIHSCTLACQYSESKKSFIKSKDLEGKVNHRVFQSTEVLLMQVLSAAVQLHKVARGNHQLMRSREWRLFERDLSWWCEHQTRAVLNTKSIARSELKQLVILLPPGLVHLSIVERIQVLE